VLGTADATSSAYGYQIYLRIGYESNSGRLLVCSKYLAAVSPQEFWTYSGKLYSFVALGLSTAPATLLSLTADGDSGPFVGEITQQTTTPYKWFGAVQNIVDVCLYGIDRSMDASADVAVFKQDAYTSPEADGPQVGILSNLLFVPASGPSGSYLWADRLYWHGRAEDSDDGRMLQLGVPGDWTVQASFSGDQRDLGSFSAFDSLALSFYNGGSSQGVLTSMRNAADLASLAAASWLSQQPNEKIAGFSPVAAFAQWKIDFEWVYSDTNAARTTSPYADSIIVGYFIGNAVIPRLVGAHWEGRTYWAVAEDGATENNAVLVLQKNKSWTKLYGWGLKSMFKFRNQLYALEAYQLIRLESGTTDMGSLIVGKARTGYIMGYVDKLIWGLQANVLSFVNNLFSNRPGHIKVVPYRGAERLESAAWAVEIPDSTIEGPVRSQGVPASGVYVYEWARAFALQIETSQDDEGDYIPYVGQPEQIQQVDVILEMTEESYDIPVQ
jgi:hypothetical protein